MGIIIDDAIHDTEVMKEYLEYRDEPRSEGLGVAINIMRKYQKIEEIVELYKKFGNIDIFMQIIREVVEDANI